MANQFINAMSDLWNSAGTTYSSIKMNVTNAASASASKLLLLQIGSVDKFSVDKIGNVVAVGSITGAGVTSSGASLPSANDSAALGASGTAWSDLFLASGGVINWNAADVTITHAANVLAHAGASSGYTFDAFVSPATHDGAALGTASVSWSDLFLATGAVLNYNNGNAILTHSDAALTVAPGDLRVTTAGSTAASVVTVGGTQTLTGKILTSPTLNTPVINNPTIGGAPTAGGATWTSLGAVTNIDLNGGTIDGTVIGATTPAAITGTSVSGASASFSTVTGTTSVGGPTGTFSTSVFGGKVQSSQIFESTGTSVILSPAAGLNTIYFRPRGWSDATGQVTIDNAGSIVATGNITGDAIFANPSITVNGANALLDLRTTSGNSLVRWFGADGGLRMQFYTAAGAQGNGNLQVGGTTFVFQPSGSFIAPANVYSGNGSAVMGTDGNISGSVWDNIGAHDAYTAIVNRIESRAVAWANDRVANLQYRKVSRGYSGAATSFTAPAGAVLDGYERDAGAQSGQLRGCYYVFLQVWDPVRGWVGFQ